MPSMLKYIPLPQAKSVNWQISYLKTLSHPMDGKWLNSAQGEQFWKIKYEGKEIGFYCIDNRAYLLQFFLYPTSLFLGEQIFRELRETKGLKGAWVSTADALMLGNSLSFAKHLRTSDYLFVEAGPTVPQIKQHLLTAHRASWADLGAAIAFYTENLGSSEQWARTYAQKNIYKRQLFLFEKENKTAGVGEFRQNDWHPPYVDLGVVVAKDFRGRQFASSIMAWMRTYAQRQQKIPICSCQKSNLKSFHALLRAGFAPKYKLLKIRF